MPRETTPSEFIAEWFEQQASKLSPNETERINSFRHAAKIARDTGDTKRRVIVYEVGEKKVDFIKPDPSSR